MNQLLLFSEVLLVWAFATGSHRLDMPVGRWRECGSEGVASIGLPRWRALLAMGMIAVVVWSWEGIPLAALTGLGVLAVFYLRHRLRSSGFLAETEFLTLLAYALLAACLIWQQQLLVGFPFLALPLEANKLALLHLASFALALSVWHSGNLVFGVLSKRHILPPFLNSHRSGPELERHGDDLVDDGSKLSSVQTVALRHGMLIGYLERLLIVILIVQNSYEGLGFLIGAKGLIRSKELTENRDLAEYFLIGSLLSVLCGVVVGLFIKFALATLW